MMTFRPIIAAVDQLVFLVLIVVAFIFKTLASRGSADKSSPPPSSRPIPRPQTPIERAPEESDADRIRKFLEALGQPTAPPTRVEPRETSPPPVVRRAQQPRRTVINPLPPLTTVPPPVPEPRRGVYPQPAQKARAIPALAPTEPAPAYEAKEAELRKVFENSPDK